MWLPGSCKAWSRWRTRCDCELTIDWCYFLCMLSQTKNFPWSIYFSSDILISQSNYDIFKCFLENENWWIMVLFYMLLLFEQFAPWPLKLMHRRLFEWKWPHHNPYTDTVQWDLAENWARSYANHISKDSVDTKPKAIHWAHFQSKFGSFIVWILAFSINIWRFTFVFLAFWCAGPVICTMNQSSACYYNLLFLLLTASSEYFGSYG